MGEKNKKATRGTGAVFTRAAAIAVAAGVTLSAAPAFVPGSVTGAVAGAAEVAQSINGIKYMEPGRVDYSEVTGAYRHEVLTNFDTDVTTSIVSVRPGATDRVLPDGSVKTPLGTWRVVPSEVGGSDYDYVSLSFEPDNPDMKMSTAESYENILVLEDDEGYFLAVYPPVYAHGQELHLIAQDRNDQPTVNLGKAIPRGVEPLIYDSLGAPDPAGSWKFDSQTGVLKFVPKPGLESPTSLFTYMIETEEANVAFARSYLQAIYPAPRTQSIRTPMQWRDGRKNAVSPVIGSYVTQKNLGIPGSLTDYYELVKKGEVASTATLPVGVPFFTVDGQPRNSSLITDHKGGTLEPSAWSTLMNVMDNKVSDRLKIPGEGVWTSKVDPETWDISFEFEPEPGFSGIPSPVSYTMMNYQIYFDLEYSEVSLEENFAEKSNTSGEALKERLFFSPGVLYFDEILSENTPFPAPTPVEPEAKFADVYDPAYKGITVQQGKDGKFEVPTGFPKSVVEKFEKAPGTPNWATVNADGTINVKVPGDHPLGKLDIPVLVRYSDGSSETVNAPLTVTEGDKKDNQKYQPAYPGLDLAPNETKTSDPNWGGTKPGTKTIELQPGYAWPAGIKDVKVDPATGRVTVVADPKVPAPVATDVLVKVTYNDGSVDDNVKVPVKVTKSPDTELFNPVYTKTKVEQGKSGKVDVPSGTQPGATYAAAPNTPGWAVVNPDGSITLAPGRNEPVGNKQIPVLVTYKDGTSETVNAPVEVTKRPEDNSLHEPKWEGRTVVPGKTAESHQLANLPDNATFKKSTGDPEWLNVDAKTGKITATPGLNVAPKAYTINVVTTYEDGTTDVVPVIFTVTPLADSFDPAWDNAKTVPGKSVTTPQKNQNMPESTTYGPGDNVPDWVKVNPNGDVVATPAENVKPGTYDVNIVVTYPDGSTEPKTVKVTVDPLSGVHDPNWGTTKVTPGDQGTVDQTVTTLPKGTKFEKTGGEDWLTVDPNTGKVTAKPGLTVTPGNYTVDITTTYPDGSTDNKRVTVEVTPLKDKFAPVYQPTDIVAGNEATVPVPLHDGKDALPQGTTFAPSGTPKDWYTVNPDGTIALKTRTVTPPGIYTVPVLVTYPDKTTEVVNASVTIRDPKGIRNVTQNPDGSVTVEFTDGSKVTIPAGKDGKDGTDGTDGQPGKDGKDGAPGRDGVDGQNGRDGKDGAPGRDGVDGQNGRDGNDGKDGKDGKDGAPGRDGVDGQDGKNGRDGIDGEPGKDGAPGKDGRDGSDGRDGKDGAPGRDGVDGQNGRDGVDGKDGAAGRDGSDGRDGKDGAPGRDGVDGKDGAAGRDGSDGRDGKDGAPGRDGVDGQNGRDGKDGAPGRDGVDGQNGRDGVDGKDGRDGSDGRDGKDGAPGRDGSDGRDGKDGRDGIGRDGKDGRGIDSIGQDRNGNTVITLTDGTTYTLKGGPSREAIATELGNQGAATVVTDGNAIKVVSSEGKAQDVNHNVSRGALATTGAESGLMLGLAGLALAVFAGLAFVGLRRRA